MNKTLYNLFGNSSLKEIFTPANSAVKTYVHRPKLEKEFNKYVGIPGMQIVLFGYTQSGKTTLMRKLLREQDVRYIETPCDGETTMDKLIINAFDEIGAYYKSQSTFSNTYGIKSEIKAKYFDLESKLEASRSLTEGQVQQRVVPVQLTAKRLSTFLGEIKCVWVIDDFHKVNEIEKKKIADVLKIFMDSADKYPKTKVLCIGAVGTAHELVQLESDLSNRVAEIPVPLFEKEELSKVVEKGFSIMKIKSDKELNINSKICMLSNSLATVCHQLCYNICYERGLEYSPFYESTTIDESDLRKSVDSFMKEHSATLDARYRKATKESLGEELLKTIIEIGKEYVSINQLELKSKKLKSLPKGYLLELIIKMTKPEFDEILRYESTSNKIHYTSPFFKAFVKMKIETEKADEAFKKKNIDMSLKESSYLSDQYLERYYGLLDQMLVRRRKAIQKEIESISKQLKSTDTEKDE